MAGPVVSLYLIAISTKELFDIADHCTGEERKEVISGAYFYGGEYHLLHGHEGEAAQMFKRVIEEGVAYLVEFAAANVELKRVNR